MSGPPGRLGPFRNGCGADRAADRRADRAAGDGRDRGAVHRQADGVASAAARRRSADLLGRTGTASSRPRDSREELELAQATVSEALAARLGPVVEAAAARNHRPAGPSAPAAEAAHVAACCGRAGSTANEASERGRPLAEPGDPARRARVLATVQLRRVGDRGAAILPSTPDQRGGSPPSPRSDRLTRWCADRRPCSRRSIADDRRHGGLRRERMLLVAYVVQAVVMVACAAVALRQGAGGCRLRARDPRRRSRSPSPGRPTAAILPSLASTPDELTAANVASGTVDEYRDRALLRSSPGLILAGPGAGAVFLVSAAGVTLGAALVVTVERSRTPSRRRRPRTSADIVDRAAGARPPPRSADDRRPARCRGRDRGRDGRARDRRRDRADQWRRSDRRWVVVGGRRRRDHRGGRSRRPRRPMRGSPARSRSACWCGGSRSGCSGSRRGSSRASCCSSSPAPAGAPSTLRAGRCSSG